MAKNNIGILAGLGIVIAGAAFYLWGRTGLKIKALEVYFESFSNDIKFTDLDFKLNIPVNIIIFNPNTQPLTFQELNCDVWINNNKVSALKYSTPVVLQPEKKTALKKVLIQTEILSAVNQALDFYSKPINMNIKGYVKANNFSFPVNENIKLK